jgi:hypothetical protein
VLRDDPELMQQIATANIAVECCVVANMGSHLIRLILIVRMEKGFLGR